MNTTNNKKNRIKPIISLIGKAMLLLSITIGVSSSPTNTPATCALSPSTLTGRRGSYSPKMQTVPHPYIPQPEPIYPPRSSFPPGEVINKGLYNGYINDSLDRDTSKQKTLPPKQNSSLSIDQRIIQNYPTNSFSKKIDRITGNQPIAPISYPILGQNSKTGFSSKGGTNTVSPTVAQPPIILNIDAGISTDIPSSRNSITKDGESQSQDTNDIEIPSESKSEKNQSNYTKTPQDSQQPISPIIEVEESNKSLEVRENKKELKETKKLIEDYKRDPKLMLLQAVKEINKNTLRVEQVFPEEGISQTQTKQNFLAEINEQLANNKVNFKSIEKGKEIIYGQDSPEFNNLDFKVGIVQSISSASGVRVYRLLPGNIGEKKPDIDSSDDISASKNSQSKNPAKALLTITSSVYILTTAVADNPVTYKPCH
jgi:hypothetical protein